MATSYTSLLGLALPVTGELSGTWGDTVNNYISTYIDAAVAGAQTVTTDTTLTKTTGTSLGSTSSQYAIIIASPASANITITAPAASKIYTIINTSATYTVKIVGAGPTTGVTLGVSEKAQVAWNGSDFVRIGASGGPGVFSSITNTSLTSGRVVYSTTGGLETDSANLTFNGTTLTANTLNLTNALGTGYGGTGLTSFTANGVVYASSTSALATGSALVFDGSNLGIGTSSPAAQLHVYSTTSGTFTSPNAQIGTNSNSPTFSSKILAIYPNELDTDYLSAYNTGTGGNNSGASFLIANAGRNGTSGTVKFVMGLDAPGGATVTAAIGTASNHALSFGTNSAERMRLDSSGNLLLGTTSVSNAAGWDKLVQIYATNYPALSLKNAYRQWDVAVDGSGGALRFYDATAGAERMRINSGGALLVGTSSAIGVGSVVGFYNASGNVLHVQGGSSSVNNIVSYDSGGSGTFSVSNGGAVSKTSGSFRIEHPLPQLSKTHDLVHSFIEGPQADLIYRGRVNLINGLATINIDQSSGMTNGTFVVLCRDVQCFTTNESDWTPVRGSVTGNILTIEAQDNTSTSSISWMVIGERQDKHMIETDWTDSIGKVIVEPQKRATV